MVSTYFLRLTCYFASVTCLCSHSSRLDYLSWQSKNRSWLPCADLQGPLVILPLKILPSGTEEMALWLSALVSLEGFESQHSHQAANNHLKLQCQKKQCPLLAFMSTAHKWYAHMPAKHPYTKNKRKMPSLQSKFQDMQSYKWSPVLKKKINKNLKKRDLFKKKILSLHTSHQFLKFGSEVVTHLTVINNRSFDYNWIESIVFSQGSELHNTRT